MTVLLHIETPCNDWERPIATLCGGTVRANGHYTNVGSTPVNGGHYKDRAKYADRYTLCPLCLESELLPMLELASTKV
jgi:hypothetical protein